LRILALAGQGELGEMPFFDWRMRLVPSPIRHERGRLSISRDLDYLVEAARSADVLWAEVSEAYYVFSMLHDRLPKRFPCVVFDCEFFRFARVVVRRLGHPAGALNGFFGMNHVQMMYNTPSFRDFYIEKGMPEKKLHYVPLSYDWCVVGGKDVLDNAADFSNSPDEFGRIIAPGRVLRDFDTLGAACETAGLRATVISQDTGRCMPRPRYLRLQQPVPLEIFNRMLNRADIVVIPLSHDSISGQLTLVHAWRHGKTVVATHVPAMSDYITDGVNGLLVPPRDPDALAAALTRVTGDAALRKKLAAAGKKSERSNHDSGEKILKRIFAKATGKK
jgi:glycosyltransferase involved in cell wall biosynthesis